jgi:hypothetical protein
MANLYYLAISRFNCVSSEYKTVRLYIGLPDNVTPVAGSWYRDSAGECTYSYQISYNPIPQNPGIFTPIICLGTSYTNYFAACGSCSITTSTTTLGPTTTTTTTSTTTTTTTAAPTTTTTTQTPVLVFHQDPYTISFDEVGNLFESFYSYHPDYMGELNTTLYTFKNGKIWVHKSEQYCKFYGVQYGANITTVFNSGALDKKTWVSLMETGNSIWACPVIYTQMETNGQKQTSSLITDDFVVLESEFHASFFKAENSPGGLIEGDSLKGGYIAIKFDSNNPNSFVYLNSATVKFINSPLNNR